MKNAAISVMEVTVIETPACFIVMPIFSGSGRSLISCDRFSMAYLNSKQKMLDIFAKKKLFGKLRKLVEVEYFAHFTLMKILRY